MSSEGEAPLVRNNAGIMGHSGNTGGKQLGLSVGMFRAERNIRNLHFIVHFVVCSIVRWCFERAIGRNFLINKQTLDIDINN